MRHHTGNRQEAEAATAGTDVQNLSSLISIVLANVAVCLVCLPFVARPRPPSPFPLAEKWLTMRVADYIHTHPWGGDGRAGLRA